LQRTNTSYLTINCIDLNNIIFILQANKAAIRVGGSGVQVNALSLDQNVATP